MVLVLVGGVAWEGVKVIIREEGMYFVLIILFLYNCGFTYVSLGDYSFVLSDFCLKFFAMCRCLLCVWFKFWLVLHICFSILAAMKRKASWILVSSNLMACSVSMMRLVQ